ncbi:MAG: SAM-dependent methyltransferase [Lachnospiraceae bacterium]|nr:SAM-dependent methyltransferase [Lachnospiraceae bacterium]
MILSKRMLMNARLIPPGHVVADIGCDHAKLSIYLVQNGIAQSVIAMDIGEGPLQRAKENIRSVGLSDKIECRLSDGADMLRINNDGKIEADVAVMAGIGGMLAIDIVKKSEEKFRRMNCFVIQAQSNLDIVRRTMYEMGFVIIDEDMEYEDGKFYTSMKLTDMTHVSHLSDDKKHRDLNLNECESIFGPVMIKKRGKVFEDYLKFEEKMCQRLVEELTRNMTDRLKPEDRKGGRLKELKDRQEMIRLLSGSTGNGE